MRDFDNNNGRAYLHILPLPKKLTGIPPDIQRTDTSLNLAKENNGHAKCGVTVPFEIRLPMPQIKLILINAECLAAILDK